MRNHGAWHTARLLERWIRHDDLQDWQEARHLYPDVKFVTEEGSGRQFLDFHRLMLRHFMWLVEHTPGHEYVFVPWADLPAWLKAAPENLGGFTSEYLYAQKTVTDSLVIGPTTTADQLGSFLESTKLNNSFGSNIHNLCHAAIAAYEYRGALGYEGAEMDDFATAHYNGHFWNLHGWLDDIYARWQSVHGEPVDQTPLDPGEGHGHFRATGHIHEHA